MTRDAEPSREWVHRRAATVAGACALTSAVLFQVSFALSGRPGVGTPIPEAGATVERVQVLTAVGWYLLLLPAVWFFFIFFRERRGDPLALLWPSFCGAIFLIIHAAGESIAGGARLRILDLSQEAGADSAVLTTVGDVISEAFGDFQLFWTFQLVLAALWWFGLGLALWTSRRPFAIATLVLGVSAVLDAVAAAVPPLEFLGFFPVPYLLALWLWIIWLGITLLRPWPVVATQE